MQFTLPALSLSTNSLERRAFLDDYFSDLIPFEELKDDHWLVTTLKPHEPSYYVDPQFERQLAQWPEPLTVGDIGEYRRRYKNGMFSFTDSWTLFYWSHVFNWLKSERFLCKNISLLHVDDQRDLKAPSIVRTAEGFQCLFSKKGVNFSNPLSIASAIEHRSIGIGSFIVPMMDAVEKLDIYHYQPSHKGLLSSRKLSLVNQYDTLLTPKKHRATVSFCDDIQTLHTYTVSSSLQDLVPKFKHDTVLLVHLDCGAFCNRYNGDSNWNTHTPSIDLNLEKIKTLLEGLFVELSTFSGEVFLSFALSPGFFPSEFWQSASREIISLGNQHGIFKDNGFQKYLQNQDMRDMPQFLEEQQWHYQIRC